MAHEPTSAWNNLIDRESGLYNHAFLVNFLGEAFARARRYGGALSCVLFRVTWWRGAEEVPFVEVPRQAFLELGKFLLHGFREGDILGRWSSQEFLLVAPNTPLDGANVCIEKIMGKLDKLQLKGSDGLTFTLRTAASAIPDDDDRVRYPEDLPLIAHERMVEIVS